MMLSLLLKYGQVSYAVPKKLIRGHEKIILPLYELILNAMCIRIFDENLILAKLN